jgi:hypothetical protein
VVPVEQFPHKINCVKLHLVGYILNYIIDPVILNFSARWRRVVSTARPLHASEKSRPAPVSYENWWAPEEA